jgi:ferredoxin
MPKVYFKNEDIEVDAPKGTNLRTLMREKGIEVYPYLARYQNCRGWGLCGTCRIRVAPAEGVTAKTKKEEGSLPGRDATWRLACQTYVEGDVRVLSLPEEPEPWYRHATYAKLLVKEEV